MIPHIFIVRLHIPPRIPSSNISNISLSVNSSNFTWVFFKHACHANPGVEKKEQEQVHIFLSIDL